MWTPLVRGVQPAGTAPDAPAHPALRLGSAGERLLARLDLRNIHFADLVSTFFDYAIIARSFRQARVAELEQVSGARQKFFVIPMASGNRKLLMYDLTSRIMDAEVAVGQPDHCIQLGAHRLECDLAQCADRRHCHAGRDRLATTSRPGYPRKAHLEQ